MAFTEGDAQLPARAPRKEWFSKNLPFNRQTADETHTVLMGECRKLADIQVTSFSRFSCQSIMAATWPGLAAAKHAGCALITRTPNHATVNDKAAISKEKYCNTTRAAWQAMACADWCLGGKAPLHCARVQEPQAVMWRRNTCSRIFVKIPRHHYKSWPWCQ